MIVYKELSSIENDLGFPIKTLYGLSNNLEKHYHNVFIPKSDGTKRKLSVPDLILKNVQRSIVDNILAYYPISKYATAYKVGSSVQKNARPHVNKKKILKLDIEGFLLTMFNSRLRLSNQVYNEVKKHFRELVFNTVIQRNIRLGEAPSMGIPALMYDAESTGAKNYLALAEEILGRNN